MKEEKLHAEYAEKYKNAILDLKELCLSVCAYPTLVSTRNEYEYFLYMDKKEASLVLDFIDGRILFHCEEQGEKFDIILMSFPLLKNNYVTKDKFVARNYNLLKDDKRLHPYKYILDVWDMYFEHIAKQVLYDVKKANEMYLQNNRKLSKKSEVHTETLTPEISSDKANSDMEKLKKLMDDLKKAYTNDDAKEAGKEKGKMVSLEPDALDNLCGVALGGYDLKEFDDMLRLLFGK